MLYLITTEQRKKIIDEYQTRIWIIAILGLIVLTIIFFVLAIPTILAIYTEKNILQEKIAPLEAGVEKIKSESVQEGAVVVAQELAILQLPVDKKAQNIYEDVVMLVEQVSGVDIQKVSVDTVTKTIQIVVLVKNKDVAAQLVDVLKKSTYAGADLPYSVLSEKDSFVFAQNITYSE